MWKYLDRKSELKRVMDLDVLNTTSVAKLILKEVPELKLDLSGVVSAVRRYMQENSGNTHPSSLVNVFNSARMNMNFDNTIIHVNKSEKSLHELSELFKRLQLLGADNVNFIADKNSFALIFDNDHYSVVRSQFSDKNIIREVKNIGLITFSFDPIVWETPNVYATILGELGANNINLIDVITKAEKLMIFVKEEDLMRTTNILYKFVKSARINKDAP